MCAEMTPAVRPKCVNAARRHLLRIELFVDENEFSVEHFLISVMPLPVNLSFLRSVDLRQLDALVIQKDLHIIEKELMRIRIRYVQTEMIDELLLFLLPFSPAIFTHFRTYLLSEFRGDRSKTERLVLLPATSAFEFVTK
jgi:hypothetical protein